MLPACPQSFSAQSCIQLVFVASAMKIISTSSPSLAELLGLSRRGWSYRTGGWELVCPQQEWPSSQNISHSSSSLEGSQLTGGTSPYGPMEGTEKAEGPGVLAGTLATFPLT